MASLTKIMTAIVCIKLAEELKLNWEETYFTVSNKGAGTIGTTAFLVDEQKVRMQDLLYGLMLPSGNDAAVTLAENFGERMRDLKRPGARKMVTTDCKTGMLKATMNHGGSFV